nr:MAG TPA: hypothetical protein [Caudoviricetes sp.]
MHFAYLFIKQSVSKLRLCACITVCLMFSSAIEL